MVIKHCDWFLFRWLLLEQMLPRWLLLLQRFPSCLYFIFVNFEQVSKFQRNGIMRLSGQFQACLFFFKKRFRAQKHSQAYINQQNKSKGTVMQTETALINVWLRLRANFAFQIFIILQ